GVMPTAHYATEVRDSEGHVVRAIAPGPVGQVISPATAKTLTTMLVGAVIVENTPEGGVTAAPLGAQVMRAALGK
ncbi:MAG TPA: hypothetical protein VH813_06480, partial [Candidatus Limnocylindrales bacterium]